MILSYDEGIGLAFDRLVTELGRTPTNPEVAREIAWRETIAKPAQAERVRWALIRLGKVRNRRKGPPK